MGVAGEIGVGLLGTDVAGEMGVGLHQIGVGLLLCCGLVLY